MLYRPPSLGKLPSEIARAESVYNQRKKCCFVWRQGEGINCGETSHGVKVPNKGLKCRSQKNVHVTGGRHANIGKQGGVHTFVNRYLYS